MLSQLFINNIAVIEKASLELNPGFTILTGETGAGKSIIIDAIHAVLGERTSKELVRSGEKSASVSALFTGVGKEITEKLKELSLPLEEDQSVLVQRDVRVEGKSLCKINGAPATVSMLKALGSLLITIHGQHESYDLLSPDSHLSYLDSFGDTEALLQEYQLSYHTLRKLQHRLDSFQGDEEEKARRIDLLRYQINEIEGADVQPGEQEALIQERDAIRNHEKIAQALEMAKNLLTGDEQENGILSDLSGASSQVESACAFLPDLEDAVEKLNEARYLLEDVDGILRHVTMDFDPAALDAIEERIEVYYRLGLKYGDSGEKILEFLERCKAELQTIVFSDEEKEQLEEAYEQEKSKAISLAKELSHRRKALAESFTELVKQELAFLNMPGIAFVAQLERVPLYAMGCDKLQFLVSANKGEAAKPMSKIASGGELSRIMLAIKTVLSGKDKIETLIFDEVDTGISGSAAKQVGKKLKQVSKNRQVLCITHLAQIAALADHHFHIHKELEGERTSTHVDELDFEGRKHELARIIGGDHVTELQLNMAEELIENA